MEIIFMSGTPHQVCTVTVPEKASGSLEKLANKHQGSAQLLEADEDSSTYEVVIPMSMMDSFLSEIMSARY